MSSLYLSCDLCDNDVPNRAAAYLTVERNGEKIVCNKCAAEVALIAAETLIKMVMNR